MFLELFSHIRLATILVPSRVGLAKVKKTGELATVGRLRSFNPFNLKQYTPSLASSGR
ncbi:MAG: hypothetical protein MK110_08010 [Fuerstiella sp.]|nr:hypothetical protein [Fuerstiella sp.]